MNRIGIISDTHGLLREEVKEILHTCDAILHCGDIDSQKTIDELKTIAPLYVVRGNADKEWAKDLTPTLNIELYGIKIFVIHNKKQIKDTGDADIILYGHSHKYDEKYEDGKLWLNPGSCGKRRFSLPVTMAVLEVENGNFNIVKKTFFNGEPTTTESVTLDCVKAVVSDIKKDKTVEYIAKKHKLDINLAEQICRLYLTHPGVDAEGIMKKMQK
jgi:putative phosphoesterase